mmetsp:Transcript_37713/g.42720  ORF Transcript_37713/g.42720 Transcript_37713/m.42720 type:complete len:159 (+) Transcript_37713:36-512(+)
MKHNMPGVDSFNKDPSKVARFWICLVGLFGVACLAMYYPATPGQGGIHSASLELTNTNSQTNAGLQLSAPIARPSIMSGSVMMVDIISTKCEYVQFSQGFGYIPTVVPSLSAISANNVSDPLSGRLSVHAHNISMDGFDICFFSSAGNAQVTANWLAF